MLDLETPENPVMNRREERRIDRVDGACFEGATIEIGAFRSHTLFKGL